MSGLTADAESDTISDIIFGGTGDAYLVLFTADPGNDPDASNEVGDSAYSRQLVDLTDWTESGDGPTTLENDVVYEFDPFDSAVGTIPYAGLADSGTQGTADIQIVGQTDPVRDFEAGDQARFLENTISLEVD
jgi:hypothetical protein